MSEKVKVYNPNDGLTGRDGGPYLDLEEARAREERSARLEGRDYNENETPRGVGIPEKTEREILDRRYIPESLKDDEDQATKIEEHLANGNLGEIDVEGETVELPPAEEEEDLDGILNEGDTQDHGSN